MSNDHPNVSNSDWNAFCAYSSPRFRQIIERGAGGIRWDRLPDVRGVAVASDYLLQLANHRSSKFPGHGYKMNYFENFGQYRLMITSILEGLWEIERYDRSSPTKVRERLVVSFGWTPLGRRNHFKAALCCGRYATMNSVSGLKWAPSH